MKECNFGFNVFNKPPEEFFDYALRYNLKHIEINLTQDHSSLKSFTNERINNLTEWAESHDVRLSFHLPYHVNISDIIGRIRKNNITYLKEVVWLAGKLNATHITAHIGNFYWFPVEKWMRRQALIRFIKNLNMVLEYCEERDVILALENVVPIPTGSEFLLLGDSVNDFEFIFGNTNSNCLKFCLDTGHANMAEGIMPYINNFRDKLVCVHYHDNKANNDEHLPVGEGTVPWQELVDGLTKINYNGPLVSECRNVKPHEASELLRSYYPTDFE